MSNNLKTIMAIVVGATTLALGSMSHAASPHQEAAPRPESLRFSPIELQPDTPMVLTGKPRTQPGPGGAKIDLSVCDLATFDHDKCLGGK